MKAWVLHGINDIRYETREKPVPGTGQVLVAVRAAGICGSDVPRIYKTGAHVHPLVPGHEFSGMVEETGPGVDTGWLGKRVGVYPLIPCGCCGPCLAGLYEMCRNYGYLGSRRDGGFAEYAVVPAANLITMPDGVSFAEAAMLEPMAVAVHAMRRVLPEEASAEAVSAAQKSTFRAEGVPASGTEDYEKIITVCGLGTIGLLLVTLLLEREKSGGKSGDMGSRLLVIGNKEFQRQKILELGLPAEAYCDSRRCDAGRWILERTGGRGADVIFECVGRNETVRQAADSAAPAGKICLVGNPASDMTLERDVYWKILRNQLTLTGTWNSSFACDAADDWHYALERLSGRKLTPGQFISHRFPMDELEKGLHIMRDKAEDYVKIMVENPGPSRR